MRGNIIAAKLAKKCKVSLLHIGSMEALKTKAMMLQYEFRVSPMINTYVKLITILFSVITCSKDYIKYCSCCSEDNVN